MFCTCNKSILKELESKGEIRPGYIQGGRFDSGGINIESSKEIEKMSFPWGWLCCV